MVNHSSHSHTHGVFSADFSMKIIIVLNAFITVAQAFVGLWIGSLSLVSDALHNLSDVVALIVSFVAHRLSQKPQTLEKTFGYKRAEILAATINATSLLVIAIFIMQEAIEKWLHPESIDPLWVMVLSAVAVVINGVSAWLLSKNANESLNFRTAYLHLFSDVLTSLAVFCGGVLIYFWNIFWIDSLLSILIAIYLGVSSVRLLKESLLILMQFAPSHIRVQHLESVIKKHDVVAGIHHVHLWQLTDKNIHLEAKLSFKSNLSIEELSPIFREIKRDLEENCGITHANFEAVLPQDLHSLDLVHDHCAN